MDQYFHMKLGKRFIYNIKNVTEWKESSKWLPWLAISNKNIERGVELNLQIVYNHQYMFLVGSWLVDSPVSGNNHSLTHSYLLIPDVRLFLRLRRNKLNLLFYGPDRPFSLPQFYWIATATERSEILLNFLWKEMLLLAYVTSIRMTSHLRQNSVFKY